MNVKSFILDIGLPGLVVLGAGLATYMLTGGPEEYPSAESPRDEFTDGCDEIEQSDEAEEIHRESMNASQPSWAKEVTNKRFSALAIADVNFRTFIADCRTDQGTFRRSKNAKGSNPGKYAASARTNTHCFTPAIYLW